MIWLEFFRKNILNSKGIFLLLIISFMVTELVLIVNYSHDQHESKDFQVWTEPVKERETTQLYVSGSGSYQYNYSVTTQGPIIDPYMMTFDCQGGRLGNQMFAYAVLYAVSKSNNRTACMSPKLSSYITKYFKASMCTLSLDAYTKTKWTTKLLLTNYDYSKSAVTNVTDQYIRYIGSPASWKYFEFFTPAILNEFEFHDNIVQRSELKILEAIKEFSSQRNKTTIVGVQVRRGDWALVEVKYKMYLPRKEYYGGAMLYFKNKYKDVIFIVASDDIPWCESNFSSFINATEYQFKIYYIRGASQEDGGLDLAVLAKCDHGIFGFGTFGFWGARLTGGEVIFCSDCISVNTFWFWHYNDYANFVLPNWIGYSKNGTQSSILPKIWRCPKRKLIIVKLRPGKFSILKYEQENIP